MFINGFDSNVYDYRDYCTLHFDTSLVDLNFDLRSQECKIAKLLHQLYYKVFDRFEWNLVYY